MPSIYRAIWSVPGGGTGYSVFTFDNFAMTTTNAQTTANNVRQAFAALVAMIPNDVTVSFDGEVTVYTDAGVLQAVVPVTPPANVTGTATGTWAGGVGARVDLQTDQIVMGRRFNGRKYLVPIWGSAFDVDGTLTVTAVNTITNAYNALLTAQQTIASPLVVWSRTHNVSHEVLSISVADKTAILRSRRD